MSSFYIHKCFGLLCKCEPHTDFSRELGNLCQNVYENVHNKNMNFLVLNGKTKYHNALKLQIYFFFRILEAESL